MIINCDSFFLMFSLSQVVFCSYSTSELCRKHSFCYVHLQSQAQSEIICSDVITYEVHLKLSWDGGKLEDMTPTAGFEPTFLTFWTSVLNMSLAESIMLLLYPRYLSMCLLA